MLEENIYFEGSETFFADMMTEDDTDENIQMPSGFHSDRFPINFFIY